MSAPDSTSELERPDIRAAVDQRFGSRVGLAVTYADLLCTTGIERGVIGPRETGRIWRRHLLNSAALADVVPESASVVDLGAGAGLPGIPLAIARPDLEVVLLEPMLRRVRFLELAVAALGLTGVNVVRGRAESTSGVAATVVVARAVADLARLARLAAGLLGRNGMLLALKGEGATAEMDEVRAKLGLEVHSEVVQVPDQPATIVRVTGDFRPLSAPVGVARSARA